jgi:hypothetical protein
MAHNRPENPIWRQTLPCFDKLAGQVKGKNGMALLTRAQRSALARAAAIVRWKKDVGGCGQKG